MDRDARAPARPPFGTPKPSPKPRLARDTAQQAPPLVKTWSKQSPQSRPGGWRWPIRAGHLSVRPCLEADRK